MCNTLNKVAIRDRGTSIARLISSSGDTDEVELEFYLTTPFASGTSKLIFFLIWDPSLSGSAFADSVLDCILSCVSSSFVPYTLHCFVECVSGLLQRQRRELTSKYSHGWCRSTTRRDSRRRRWFHSMRINGYLEEKEPSPCGSARDSWTHTGYRQSSKKNQELRSLKYFFPSSIDESSDLQCPFLRSHSTLSYDRCGYLSSARCPGS